MPSPPKSRRSRPTSKQDSWSGKAGLKLTRWAMAVSLPGGDDLGQGGDDDRPRRSHSVLVSGDKPNNDSYKARRSRLIARRRMTAIRLEVLPHESLPEGGPGRAPLFSVGNFLLSEARGRPGTPWPPRMARRLWSSGDRGPPRPTSRRLASLGLARRSMARPIPGWAVGRRRRSSRMRSSSSLKEPGRVRGLDRAIVLTLDQTYIHQTTIGRFRVSTTSDPQPPRGLGIDRARSRPIALIPPG